MDEQVDNEMLDNLELLMNYEVLLNEHEWEEFSVDGDIIDQEEKK